jgi:hypothetical protein
MCSAAETRSGASMRASSTHSAAGLFLRPLGIARSEMARSDQEPERQEHEPERQHPGGNPGDPGAAPAPDTAEHDSESERQHREREPIDQDTDIVGP